MLTEFIGLPGSGKTTFEKTLTQPFEAKNTLTRESLAREEIPFRKLCLYFLRHKRLVSLFMLGTLYNFEFEYNLRKWRALIGAVKITLVQYAKIDLAIKNNPDLKVIMDEGLLERTISIYSFHIRKHNLYLMNKQLALIAKMGVIDKVYYLKVSRSLSILRCQNRSDGLPLRYKRLDDNELVLKFDNKLLGLEAVKPFFYDRFIEVENE